MLRSNGLVVFTVNMTCRPSAPSQIVLVNSRSHNHQSLTGGAPPL